MMNKFLYLLLIGCLMPSVGQAQSFQYRAVVDPVSQSGYHQILLPPAVVGQLNSNLTDIRLYNDQHQEIPYILKQQLPQTTRQFVDYEVVSKVIRPYASTKLLVRNRAKNQINSLHLVIKNTNVGKKARLSGSSDAQNWYAIDDAVWLAPGSDNLGTTAIKQIDFPRNDYEYYRLEINDSLSSPLNILRVGYYTTNTSAGRYSTLPDLSVSQRDSSDKKTYVHLVRSEATRFDKISFTIRSATPYRRWAELGQLRTRSRKRRPQRWFDVIRSFELRPADNQVVYLPGVKARDLYLVIDNEDNPPLTISAVRAYQLTTYLLADLTAGSTYELHFSAATAEAPVYDLAYVKTGLPADPLVVGVGTIRSIQPGETPASSFLTDSRLIWPVLGLVLFVLGLLSYRMLREMERPERNS